MSVKEILFKLATNDRSDGLPVDIKTLALMGRLPLPKGYV